MTAGADDGVAKVVAEWVVVDGAQAVGVDALESGLARAVAGHS